MWTRFSVVRWVIWPVAKGLGSQIVYFGLSSLSRCGACWCEIRPFHLRGLRFGFSFSLLLFFSRLVYLVSLLSPLCVDHGRWCEIWVSPSSCLKPKVVRELCIYIYTHTHRSDLFTWGVYGSDSLSPSFSSSRDSYISFHSFLPCV